MWQCPLLHERPCSYLVAELPLRQNCRCRVCCPACCFVSIERAQRALHVQAVGPGLREVYWQHAAGILSLLTASSTF